MKCLFAKPKLSLFVIKLESFSQNSNFCWNKRFSRLQDFITK